MHLLLIDASALIYRSYFAVPSLRRISDGLPVNALYGVSQTLWSLLKKVDHTHIAAVFDLPKKTFRHEIYPGYKAHRPARPSPLASQIPLIRNTFEAFGVPTLDAEGFEADDLIATYAKEATRRGWHTQVVSVDKDMIQLVNDNVFILNPNMTEIDAVKVYDTYGVHSYQFADYLALMGDVADNVPGVPRIGSKKAVALLRKYHDLETILAVAKDDSTVTAATRHALIRYADAARLSKRLVVLADVPMDIPLEWLNRRKVDYRELVDFLTDYECLSLAKQVSEYAGLGVLGG